MNPALTISLACFIDSSEVLLAAALVGSLRVIADVGTHSKQLTLILICETTQRIMSSKSAFCYNILR